MIRYIFKRILAMIPVIIGVTILIFTLLYFAKGEPAQMILGSDATKEEVDQLNEKLGLDKPYFERLTSYMEDVFLHFDMGRSYFNEASVTEDVMQRFPITLKLSLLSVTLADRDSAWGDRGGKTTFLAGQFFDVCGDHRNVNA